MQRKRERPSPAEDRDAFGTKRIWGGAILRNNQFPGVFSLTEEHGLASGDGQKFVMVRNDGKRACVSGFKRSTLASKQQLQVRHLRDNGYLLGKDAGPYLFEKVHVAHDRAEMHPSNVSAPALRFLEALPKAAAPYQYRRRRKVCVMGFCCGRLPVSGTKRVKVCFAVVSACLSRRCRPTRSCGQPCGFSQVLGWPTEKSVRPGAREPGHSPL